MPVLSNPKHELFAQELAKGSTIEKAYVAAGYKPNRGNATVLKQKQNISTRLNELLALRDKTYAKATEKAAEALAIDREWIMARLKENAERALQAVQATGADGQLGDYKYEGSVANRALELLGKEIGMFIDRKDVTVRNTPSELSDSELEAIIRGPRSEEQPHSLN